MQSKTAILADPKTRVIVQRCGDWHGRPRLRILHLGFDVEEYIVTHIDGRLSRGNVRRRLASAGVLAEVEALLAASTA